MEMSQPHVIIHTSNVSCFTAFPYSKPYYGSSVPTYLSTGMSARESLVALWNQSFSRKAFLIRLSLMPVNSWVWRNGIKLRVYRIAAGTFCMVLLVLGRVSALGFIRPAVTHPWNLPASTVYALVWNQNLWSRCAYVSLFSFCAGWRTGTRNLFVVTCIQLVSARLYGFIFGSFSTFVPI